MRPPRCTARSFPGLWPIGLLMVLSCSDERRVTSVDPVATVQPARVTVAGLRSVTAGTRFSLAATVSDSAGHPMAGVAVTWLAAPGVVVDSSATRTDASGKASFSATAPTGAGPYDIVTQAGSPGTGGVVTSHTVMTVVPDVPVTVRLDVDSVRFTRLRQSTVIAARVFDRFGNQRSNLAGITCSATTFEITCDPNAPASVAAECQCSGQIGVSLGYDDAPRSGEAQIRPSATVDGALPVLARVRVYVDLIPYDVQVKGFRNADLGIAVGESRPFSIVVLDSLGLEIAVSPARAGVTFASSNPSVATLDSNGVVTGRASGTVTLTAVSAGKTYTAQTTVWPYLDLGRFTPIAFTSYDMYGTQWPTRVDDFGNSLRVSISLPHAGSTYTWSATLRDPMGNVRWESTGHQAWGDDMASPEGGFYLAYGDTSYSLSPEGTVRWKIAGAGVPATVFPNNVFFQQGSVIQQVSANGLPGWRATFPSAPAAVVASASRVYVWLAGPTLVALDRVTGAQLWSRSMAPSTADSYLGLRSPLTDEQSRLFAAYGNTFFAFDASGAALWTRPVSAFGDASLAGTDAVVYSDGRSVLAIDRSTGGVLWQTAMPRDARQTVSGNRVIVSAGYLFALDVATGRVLGEHSTDADMAYGDTDFTGQPKCTRNGLFITSGVNNSGLGRYERC